MLENLFEGFDTESVMLCHENSLDLISMGL